MQHILYCFEYLERLVSNKLKCGRYGKHVDDRNERKTANYINTHTV